MYDSDLSDPKASARALALGPLGNARSFEPLTFGMTFPFSLSQLSASFWMASGGVDPDEDVRLVVAAAIHGGQPCQWPRRWFLRRRPWNSVAVDMGVGNILHFGCEIMTRASERRWRAARAGWTRIRTHSSRSFVPWPASEFAIRADNRISVAHIVAQRLGTNPELVVRTLTGQLDLPTAPDGSASQIRSIHRYRR